MSTMNTIEPSQTAEQDNVSFEIMNKMKHTNSDKSIKTVKFARLIVECPCLLCMGILLLLAAITYVDGHYFVYTTDANRLYLVETDEWVTNQDGFVLAQQYIAISSTDNETVTPQTQIDGFWTYQLMFKIHDYSSENSWILTKKNIDKIIEYENKIYFSPEWQNKFCYIVENNTNNNFNFSCKSSIQSIARDIYYNTNYSTMNEQDIKHYVLSTVINNPYYSVLFNPDINESNAYIYRSIFHAAKPIGTGKQMENDNLVHISQYKNAEDRPSEQEEIYTKWAQTYWVDITVQHNGGFIDGDLEILALSYVVFVEYFLSLLSEAMFFVIFAIGAVYIYMSIHLKSCIIAFAALIEILMSFPLAFFFYRLLFQVTHFDTFSSLIIFVLLGVGADDVFVFTDAWYQSINFVDYTKDNILLQRMSFAYSRASKAMFITQITTFFAFMATATSQIMPISAFGIWAATIVACNYMLVITMYPCIIILHEKYLNKIENIICCGLCNLCCKYIIKKKENNKAIQKENDYRWIERFWGGKFTDFILKSRVYLLVFFALLYILCGIGAFNLKPNEGDETWFEDDHFMKIVEDSANEFTAGETDGLFEVWIVWGIHGVDRKGTNKWDSEDYGTVIFDESFDMSSIEGQLFIKNICDDLKTNHLSFSKEGVVCFTDNFEQYLLSQNLSYPVSLSNDKVEQQTLFAEMMHDFLHFSEYGEYIRDSALVYVEENKDDATFSLKFVSIQVLSDVSWDDTNNKIDTEFNLWNEYMDNNIYTNDKCPDGVCLPYHTSWVWAGFATKNAFISSAIQGVLIAMPLAFIILLISTRNWIISIFAVLDIIGIMLCELALMVIMEWEFGISEAISIVMIIGFSVDYVVHLANAYLECNKENINLRNQRLRYALLTMGISIISGAITTFSAGFFLIFPTIIFFKKMGILMMSTIAFSIFFAMFFFTSLLAQFGPQHENGNINFKKILCFCCIKKEEKQENKSSGDIEMR